MNHRLMIRGFKWIPVKIQKENCMIEELPDDIENDIDDIEPVGEEADAQL